MTAGRASHRAVLLVVSLAFVATSSACGGGNWLRQEPELARRARTQPGSFVQPALEQWEGAAALTGSYSMRVTRGIGGRSFDLAIAARRPADVDMLVLDPTGAIQLYLRANEREVGLYVAEERTLYRGAAGRDAFGRALGFELSAADAVALLLGYGVDRDSLPLGRAAWDDKARRVRIDHGEAASAWLLPPALRFDRVEHRGAGGTVAGEILEWLDMAFPVPSRLRLQVEPDGYGIELRLVGNVDLTPEFPAGFFDLQAGPSIQQRPLADLAAEGGLFRR